MDASVDPFAQFRAWMADAEASEPNDPNAMTVATVAADGTPSARILLLKGLDERGFTFFTNRTSRKGGEIAANAQVALCFHWKTVRRQVRAVGTVEWVSEAESDAYFASRARGSQVGAHASLQSQPLDERATLEARVQQFEREYDGRDVPRPAHWGGYRLVPREIEFWQDQPYRLHDRFVFIRSGEGQPWSVARLYP